MPILSVLSAGLPARPFLGALMLALGLVAGAAPAAPEGAFEAAMRHFDAAQTGDAAALEQAVAAIDGLRKAEPTNPLLLGRRAQDLPPGHARGAGAAGRGPALRRGEMLALTGPSGSGKSTLLHLSPG
jgi:ABC-type protease/lipase transport system fused ATPase/permease subunit